jgi:hypothetical protein
MPLRASPDRMQDARGSALWDGADRQLSGKSSLYGGRLALDHAKKCTRCPVRTAASLFPILHRVQLESEPCGKIALRKPQPLAYNL